MNIRNIAGFLISLSFLVSADLSAHHGAAVYDTSEVVTVKGAVTQFRFVFPHTLIYIAVTSDDGETVEWSGEMTTPNRLARGIGPGGVTHAPGWTNDTLKPGDVIELTGNPARNGAPSLRLISVYNADGVALAGRRPGDTAAPLESVAANADLQVADATDLAGVWIYNYSHSWENYAFTEELPSMTPWGRERLRGVEADVRPTRSGSRGNERSCLRMPAVGVASYLRPPGSLRDRTDIRSNSDPLRMDESESPHLYGRARASRRAASHRGWASPSGTGTAIRSSSRPSTSTTEPGSIAADFLTARNCA